MDKQRGFTLIELMVVINSKLLYNTASVNSSLSHNATIHNILILIHNDIKRI